MVSWILIDDQDDAAAYVAKFAEAGIGVEHVKPSEARPNLLRDGLSVTGILMDVDLSGEVGNFGTGLGLAQDVRAAQKAGTLIDFPIIRFANPGPVARNVRGDPTSDDLFDEFVYKSEVGADLGTVVAKLMLTQSVYVTYLNIRESGKTTDDHTVIEKLLGLPIDKIEDWVHPGLVTRLMAGLTNPIHVSAGVLLRTCLNAVGPLIDTSTVGMRLGISDNSLGENWGTIRAWLDSVRYVGVGSDHADRWWATGLDNLWKSIDGTTRPLSSMTISERRKILSEYFSIEFEPLTMPQTSPGDRPWRWCQLSLEELQPELVPVDPSQAVKMTMPVDQPAWVDPLMSSKGAAVRKRNDPRFGPFERAKL